MKRISKAKTLKKTMINYAKMNSKEYILVILIFVIGLFIGVMFINNVSSTKEEAITTYITEFIEKFKNTQNIDKPSLIASSVKTNITLAIILWLAGTTIIGMLVVLAIILFRGFCIGYTVSAITLTIGVWRGIVFCMLALLLQNIIFIPALLTTGVSSIKLYKSIITDRRRENIKLGIIKHTIICLLMLGVLILSSFIENIISINLLKIGIKFFWKIFIKTIYNFQLVWYNIYIPYVNELLHKI